MQSISPCVQCQPAAQCHLPQQQRLLVLLCHVAETREEEQQLLLQLDRRHRRHVPLQKLWVIQLHVLDTVVRGPFHQDAVGVHYELGQGRMKSRFVAELNQPLHDVTVPPVQVMLVALIHLARQRVGAHLEERTC